MHLINEGITTTSSADGGVIIEWGLSAPSDAVISEIGFQCSLDGGPTLDCKIIVCMINYTCSYNLGPYRHGTLHELPFLLYYTVVCLLIILSQLYT